MIRVAVTSQQSVCVCWIGANDYVQSNQPTSHNPSISWK